jgi:hypothetical protein
MTSENLWPCFELLSHAVSVKFEALLAVNFAIPLCFLPA